MSNEQISSVWFLAPDLEDLDAEIARIRAIIRETKLEAQEGTEQSSESWHDNYVFEESQRQLKMYLNHLGGLSKARERAEVISAPTSPEEVTIGTTVSFRIEEERISDTFSIGSYMVFDRLRELDFISYETPIASILMGAKVGDVRSGVVAGRTKTLLIQSITSAESLLSQFA